MKQSSKKHELGTAALYCRLSRDDNMDSESNSIQNQRKILQKAAKDKGYTDTVFFVDDGITGTTMKRPGFQKMLTAIEAGYISAVFVKDLSRLGRNYIEVGKLTEEFFPLHDIRLVAVSDGVDSDEGEDDFTPFKNIMNEYYAKDISKKRRIVNKMKGNAGVPLSPPPYGYIKNPDDPRFWVVEPEAAEVVRRIYRMALEGYGLAETAARLAADGVVNPTYYWRSRGTSRGGSKSTVEPTKWGHTTVKKILTLQEYCGDVINFKSYSKSYKMKKRIENPEENRAIFLNVHEAIIDRQTWEKVQALQKGTRRKKPTVTQEPSVFSGLLKCPECGGNLNFHFNQNNHDIKFFSCQNHNSGYRKCSKTHYIRLDFLEQVVLYEVKRLACFASEYENDFIKAMIGRSAKVAENTALRKQRELDALTARDRELDMLFERLYEDNVAGKIDDARFAKMSKRYEQEQGENAKKIKALRLERGVSQQQLADAVNVLISGDGNENAATQYTIGTGPISGTKGTLAYDQLVEFWGQFDPYTMNTILCSTATMTDMLKIPELQNPLTGLNFQGTGKLSTPLGAQLHRTSAVSDGVIIGLDNRYALELVRAGDVLVEYDKLIDRQLERAAITSISGFGKIMPEASKVLVIG